MSPREDPAPNLSLRHALSRTLIATTDVDARGYRTYRALLTRPGLLTVAYAAGRRAEFIRPLALFLITNLIYFLYHTLVDRSNFGLPLDFHLDGQFYSEYARALVQQRFGSTTNPAFTLYRMRFDLMIGPYAKALLVLMIPVFALAVALLRAGRREPGGLHLVFAAHFLTVLLVVLMIVPPVLLLLAQPFPPRIAFHVGGDAVLGTVLAALLGAYLFAACRRVYGIGTPGSLLMAALLTAVLVPIAHAYRLAMFLLVFATVR